MTSKEKAKKDIESLVQKFEDHRAEYKQTEYNETQTRRDFIDPFFEALGWDISNKEKMSEAYREVIHEDKVKVENKLKSPDYSFRVNGKRYFFVEAKKPSVNIKDDIQPAYQVKRYAWSAKLKISIATDFEEFAVYDCTNKPDPEDKASASRIEYIKYDEYLKKFDFIWDTFSKEAVLSGSHEKFLKKDKKKGTTSVDDDFLESLDKWRTTLAKDLHKNNPKLSEDYLNLVVQNTIDRIIFLRIAEDRHVEIYGSIQKCLNDKDIYQALFKLFTNADDKYNSGLFDFEKDKISKSVIISNKCLENIIEDLYFPKSPYEFSVIPVEILGSAYEQFLGKTIQIKNGKIVIEEKPEVRKAGGVYYTPQYIVDYIVQNTVGKLIEGKKPTEIEKIKILDPASGSGSFLLGAYDYLLRYHLDWYSKNAAKSKGKKGDPLNPDGSLTTEIKKKILLNNIFGVDIDASAVEVTKLSLLLKCLEGETQASIKSQLSLFNERVLPTLDQNIKCGNSLISTDFYDLESNAAILKKIKPFNWQIEFKEIFKNGGFDAVIGNPPWGAIFSEIELEYLKKLFSEVIVRMIDSFMYFSVISSKFINGNGMVGLILPDVVLYQSDNSKLRKKLVEKFNIISVLNMGNVFKKVIRPSAILVFSKKFNSKNKINYIDVSGQKTEADKKKNIFNSVSYNCMEQSAIVQTNSYLFKYSDKSSQDLIQKIYSMSKFVLSDLVDGDGIQRGVSPDLKSAFIVDSLIVKKYNLEKNKLKNTITGGVHIKKFRITRPDLKVIYTTRTDKENEIPNIVKFIKSHKDLITCKEVKLGKHPIFSLHRPREEQIFVKPKKIVGVITEDRIVVALDCEKLYPTDGVYLFNVKDNISHEFVLGLLNSQLFLFLYRFISMEKGRVMAQVKPTVIEKMPIVEAATALQKQAQDKIVKSVNRIIELNKSDEPDSAQVLHYENEVDKLVYELYGLTQDEIKIIEEAIGGN